MSFKTCSLASLSSLITKGTTPTTLGYAHSDSGIPFLRVQNIFSGQVNFKEDTLFIDSNTHTALKRSQIQGGDVLVTIAGTIGRTGVVPHDAPEMNCNQAVAIVRPTQEIERSYLRHWLESQEARSQMLGSTVTGTISNLSLSQLGELRVPQPPLGEQRRIALALVDSLTQSLFLDMFGDPLIESSGKPFYTLGTVCEKISDGTHHSPAIQPNGVPYITAKHLKAYGLDFHADPWYVSVEDHQTIYSRCDPKPNDVLYIKDGATTGLAAINNYDFEFSMLSSLALLRPNEELISACYLCHWLNNNEVREKLIGEMAGAAIRRLTLSKIKAFRLPVPPLPLQQTFATRIASIEALKTTHRRALAALDALFASLRQRAFSGELTLAAPRASAQSLAQLQQLEASIGQEALIFIAKRMPDGDLYNSLKAIYFADRHHLEHHGRQIYNETYSALRHGPVPQAAYDATEVLIGKLMLSSFDDGAVRAALRRNDKKLTALRDADFSKLSRAVVESLEWGIRYCRDMKFGQTKTASHDSAYERTPKNEAIPLQYIIDTLPPEARQRHWGL